MRKEIGKLIADVWEDAALKARFKADPKAVLGEYGVPVPAGVTDIRVVENDVNTMNVVLPPLGRETEVVRPLEELPSQPSMDALIRHFVTKAGKDPAFRALALGDPPAALKQLGIVIPAGYVVKVLEDTASLRYFALPMAPSAELTAEQLEQVAGGRREHTAVKTQAVEAVVEATTVATTTEVAAEADVAALAEVAVVIGIVV